MTEKAEVKKPQMKLLKKTAPAAAEPEVVSKVKIATKAKAEVVDNTNATDTEKSDDLIVQVAQECESLKEDKAFKLIPTLLNNIDHDYFKLGGVLAVIQSNAWFMDKGFDNFKAYLESETGINYRKAMYLVSIYNGLVASGVKWGDVSKLGWTKLKELAMLLPPANVDEWVEVADGMTVLQLQEYIKTKSAAPATSNKDAEKGATKTTTMTFKLHSDQKETVRAALDKAKHESGTDVDSVALEHICLDFLGGTSKLATPKTLAELMKGKSAEEVLEAFGTVFPDVELSAEIPE